MNDYLHHRLFHAVAAAFVLSGSIRCFRLQIIFERSEYVRDACLIQQSKPYDSSLIQLDVIKTYNIRFISK